MYNKINFYKLNLLIIVIAFFLSIKPSLAQVELDTLPTSLCSKIYEKLNLGETDLKEKIEVYVKYNIEYIKINEKTNTFGIMLEKRYNYKSNDLLKVLKENFSEDSSIKDFIGKSSGKSCVFDYKNSLREKKIINLRRYYSDEISKKHALSYVKIYPSGGVLYRFKDEYSIVLEPKFDFRKFPFDKHTIVVAEYTQIYNYIEFIRSEKTVEYFKEMNKNKNFTIISPGWTVTEVNQYDYFTPKDWNDDEMKYNHGSVQVFITLERNSFSYLLKFAFPIIFIVLISWGVFWIDPKDIKTRAELSIISLLSLIAFNFVISDKLPDLNYLTLLDSLILTSYLFAGAATIISIMVNIYARKLNKKLVAMIDHQARVWGPIVYILFNLIFGYAVVTNPI